MEREGSQLLIPIDQSGIVSTAQSRTLDRILDYTSHVHSVMRGDLVNGDWVLVTTKNSVYTICCQENDSYTVSGGWFDGNGMSPLDVRVNGCTWGGSAIHHDIIAAPGLFLEFGNGVKTTRIQSVRIIRNQEKSKRPATCH